MTDFHGIPRVYGMIVIAFGLLFFAPLLGFVFEQVGHDGNWNIVMFVLTVLALSASVLMMAFGTNIVWYHDKKIDDRSQEEIAKHSKYQPKESDSSDK